MVGGVVTTYEYSQVTLAAALVAVTILYVVVTFRLLKATQRQAGLTSTPMIGIRPLHLGVDRLFPNQAREMDAAFEIVNVGTGPAARLRLDVILTVGKKKGSVRRQFVANYPSFHPFFEAGQTAELMLGLSAAAVRALLADFRMAPDGWDTPSLTVFVYYSDGMGQGFESRYDMFLGLDPAFLERVDEEGNSAWEGPIDIDWSPDEGCSFICRTRFLAQIERILRERESQREVSGAVDIVRMSKS
jgi:hypothetical protein